MVRDDGGPIRMRHALVRALLAVIEIIFSLGSIALITSLLNVRGKRLGDLLAGTFVLRERGGAAAVPLPGMPMHLATWAVGADMARLPDGLAVGARRFLAGAPGLHPASRHQLGSDLAAQVSRFVAPPPPPGTHPEAFLAAVLVERRRRDHERLARLEHARAARLGERSRAAVLSPTATRLLGDQPLAVPARSVPVVVRLVRALDVHADVLGLVLAQLGELDAERVEVQAGDLLVEVLGQHVDLAGRRYRRSW